VEAITMDKLTAREVRIAVVDDDAAFREFMVELLTDEGYTALIGKEAVTAYEMIKKEAPALVILDLIMHTPDDGWGLLELLRLDPVARTTPVIVCSGDMRSLRENREKLREKYCTVLEKPFDVEQLLAKVREVLSPSG